MTNFICTNCGNKHSYWPALAFNTPDYYAIPHQEFEHPFVHDFYQGINTLEAQRRVDSMLLNKNNTP